MKKIIKQMENLQMSLEEKITKREEYFDSKSEKWQDSEKGESFTEMSDRLQDMLDEVIEWQEELGAE